MLPKQFRLRQATAVKRVRLHGQSWRHSLTVLLVEPNGLEYSRFGFVASRRVGNAVQRNRSKRLLREAVRPHLSVIQPGWDCLFIARHPLPQASARNVMPAVAHLLVQAGLLPGDEGVA